MMFPTECISIVSIVCIVITLIMLAQGYKDGFLLKLCDLLSTIISFVLAWNGSAILSEMYQLLPADLFSMGISVEFDLYINETLNKVIFFFMIFVIGKIIFALIRPLLKFVNEIPLVGSLNKILGIVMGGLHAYFILILVTIFFSSAFIANGNEVLQESKLIYVKESVPFVKDFIYGQYETIQTIDMNDKFANLRIWMEEKGIQFDVQEAIIESIKNRSE